MAVSPEEKVPMEDDSDFNFEKWIAEYKLNDIKQCFIDYDMTTLNNVNMNNPNFSNLMADQRIILKAYLMQNVINGMQSLEKLRAAKKEKELEQKTKDIKKTKENKKLVFMTENETKVLRNIQQYIENGNNLQNELKNKMYNNFQLKKEENCKQIEKNKTVHLQKFGQMSTKISKTFEPLHKNLDKRREILQDTIDGYQQQIDTVTVSHNEKITNINDTLQNCLSMIDAEIKYLQNSMQDMFFVVNKYAKEENECHSTIDHHNNAEYKYYYDNAKYKYYYVESRENKLIKMCDITTEHYLKKSKLLHDELNKLSKYTNFELKLIDVDAAQNGFTINIDNNVYKGICDDVEQLIKLDQKQDIEEEENKYNEDEEKAEELTSVVTTHFDEHWYNAEKWQLSHDRKSIKGIHYAPFITYCVYFSNNGYDEGVHYLRMQCDKIWNDNGDISKINCCIGVTSERNRHWTMDGVCDNWPNKGSYSFFNASKERPYWYPNESITIKLDIYKLMVYYYKSNEESSGKDLVKQERINKATNFYFMMCADSDPTLQYSLVL